MSIRGTNLGIQSSDVLSVTIGDSTCDIDYSEYIPGKRFPYRFTCIYSCLLVCLLLESCVGREGTCSTCLKSRFV